MKEAWYKKV